MAIDKRGNSYRIRVSLGYDATGKRYYATKSWTPEPDMTQRQIEEELKRLEVEFENEVKSGSYAKLSKQYMSDFCQQYLENVSNSLEITTLESYKRTIDNFIIPALGHFRLNEIQPLHIQKFVNQLCKEGVRADNKDGKLSPATIQRIYSVLRSILSKACKMDLIKENPAKKEKIDMPKKESTKIEIFTQEELSYLLECLENEDLKFQVLIQLALNTGCRRGELIALKWSDINFYKKIISINKANVKVTGKEIHTKNPKNRSSIREISVSEPMLKLLKTYREEQIEYSYIMGHNWSKEDWIFTQVNGKPMYPDTPSSWFKKFQEKYDITPIRRFHALRHTSATLLLTSGTNIKTVSSRLGHTDIGTTNIYVHSIEEADQIAANTLSNILNQNNRKISQKET